MVEAWICCSPLPVTSAWLVQEYILPAGKIMMIAFRSPPSSIASSQPQHAAGPNYILGPICFLGGHLTAWMSQILCLLPVELPILPAYRNHHPSHRSTVSTGLMVREPSFEALDWAHVKARRHLPSSVSSTADDVAMPWAEECAHL